MPIDSNAEIATDPASARRPPASTGTVSLETIIINAEIDRRASRPADYETENRALASLMQEMARSSANILQALAHTVLDVCRAHSAGISILEERDGRAVFVWRGLAGAWSAFLGGIMPREFSPCGAVLDRNASLLLAYPQRHFSFPAKLTPGIVEVLLVPFHVAGQAVGTLWIIAHDTSRRFDAEDKRLLMSLGNFAGTAYQVLKAQECEAQAAADLHDELAATQRLQEISGHLLLEGDPDTLYHRILDAAVDLMRSDAASMQMLHRERGALRLIAHTGLASASATFWDWVDPDSGSVCGEALATAARVVVADVDACSFIAEADMQAFRTSGIRAVQSTPLVSRSGHLVGMLSTHWRRPHRPRERDLRLLDVLARQAADLIERAQTQTRLRASEARATRVLESTTDSLQVYGGDWRLLYMNAASRRALSDRGLEPETLIGKHFFDDIFPGTRGARLERECMRAMNERVPVELEYLYGPWQRWYAINAYPIEEGGVTIYFQDITERKHAQIALERSEANLRDFLERAPIGIHWVDANGMIIWANRAELDMLGYTREEYVGHPIGEFHADRTVIERILAELCNGATLTNYEAHVRHKDGSIRHVAINSNAMRVGGQFVHTRCFTRDITEKKRLEEQTRTQFEELENVYRTAPIGLALIDRDFRFARVNERLAEINGMPSDQQIGRRVRDVVPDLADQAEKIFRTVLDTGEAILGVEFDGETAAQPGVRRAWRESWYPLKDAAGATVAVSVVVEEITEQKRAARTLAESVRIKDALYRLADRLHHARSLDVVHAAALDAIVSAMQCERASILLYDASGVMRFVAWHGLSDAYRGAVEGHSPWTPDQKDPDPVCVPDIAAADLNPALKATVCAEGIGALAFIPLVTNRRLIGKFMIYFNAPHHFTGEELDLAMTIAHQLAFGIERKRADEMLQLHARQLALITDTAPVFIAYCDDQARFRFVNSAYAARFGLAPQDCIGRRIADVVGEQTYASFERYVQMALHGEPVDFEVAMTYPGIGERFMRSSYAPEVDGEGRVVGFVAAITDITERKHIEEALRASEERLLDADRRKDEFLATLAHELRNPLAPLLNGLQLMKLKRTDTETVGRVRAMMERQVGHMVRLIDDLLDVSRISRGKIELRREPVELAKVIQQAVETNRPLIEANEQDLTVEMPARRIIVDADVARLAQVVGNLLNNAAKFTPKGGAIRLAVEQAGAHAVVRVCDTGIGIAADHFARIFEMFMQVDTSLERTQSGLGIGLTLVKTLTEMHGGTVEVDSRGIGHGSEFVVRLPMQAAALDSLPVQPHATGGSTALRVLVVDDNADAADSLAALLALNGHDTRVANDGLEALQIAADFMPNLMLLDIGLPKLNGYEVARRLREQPLGRDVVLVALTGWGQDNDRRQSKQAGFDSHLVKPIDHDALTQLLAGFAQHPRVADVNALE